MAVLIRQDVKTGVQYNEYNIPYGRLNSVTTKTGERYSIIAMNSNHPDDSWYNGCLVSEKWAVFKLTGNIWQQVSPWYSKYGLAIRKLCSESKESI